MFLIFYVAFVCLCLNVDEIPRPLWILKFAVENYDPSFVIAFVFHRVPLGLGKIYCNRYSIAIFFTFCTSNALSLLLFMSIEYGLVFTFFRRNSIFHIRFFFCAGYFISL